LLNPYEIVKIAVNGDAFFEEIVFENLPSEDEVFFGDCIIGTEKKLNFVLRNNGNSLIKFNWNT